VFLSWSIYALYYLCRVHYSIAIPIINYELGLSHCYLGLIASGFFITYGLGQLVIGYLSFKYRPEVLLLIGVAGSSLMSIVFGLSSDFMLFLVIWTVNGFFQSMGWPTLVKIVSGLSRKSEMGLTFGLFNTSWALGHMISWLFSGYIISILSWRACFLINGLIFWVLGGISCLKLIKYSGRMGLNENWKLKKSFPRFSDLKLSMLSLFSIAYFIADAVRYGLITYLPSFIYSIEKSAFNTALISMILPLIGSIGMVFTGLLIDKFPRRFELPFLSILITLSMLFVKLFPTVYVEHKAMGVIVLAIMSFLLYGIESQLSSTIPIKIIGTEHSSIIAGVINCVGAFGAFVINALSGFMIDEFGFNFVFSFWSIIQLIEIIVLIVIYIALNLKSSLYS